LSVAARGPGRAQGDACLRARWQGETETFSVLAAEYPDKESPAEYALDTGPGSLARLALQSAEPRVVEDLGRGEPLDSSSGTATPRAGSALHVLIGRVDEPWGVLGVYGPSPRQFGARDAQFALTVAQVLTMAVRQRSLEHYCQQQLEVQRGAVLHALQAIAVALESRDPYTAGHQRRVAKLAVAIGQTLGMDEQRLQGLRVAGIVHNLGKVFLPWNILAREGPLSAVEFGLVKTHPQLGHEILQEFDFPWPLAEIVLQHHERLDGSGYPSGLRGDEILLEARIITVADVVEAMVSDRRYRPARDISTALEEIAENRGRYYDPGVVNACLRLFKEQSFSFD
jgi:hypothetical protein